MTLNAQPIYATGVKSRIAPYLHVCHAGTDDRHLGRRHDRHLLYNRGRNCSSWHKSRKLSRPIVRHMLCLLGARHCLLGSMQCLLGAGHCLLGNTLRLLGAGHCLLGSTLCLLGHWHLLCLLLVHIVLRRVTPGLLCISPTLCLLRTLTNRSLIRLTTPLCWLSRLVPTTVLTSRLNIVCSSGLTTRVSS